jgi:hypothetical protein
VCVQVNNASGGASAMTFEFVAAKHGKVLDRLTLHNTLRRDGVCSYCFSRTGGFVRAGSRVRGACDPSTSTWDLKRLRRERKRGEARGGVQLSGAREDAKSGPDYAWGDPDGDDFEGDDGGDADDSDELSAEEMHAAGHEIDEQSDDSIDAGDSVYTQSYNGSAVGAVSAAGARVAADVVLREIDAH